MLLILVILCDKPEVLEKQVCFVFGIVEET